MYFRLNPECYFIRGEKCGAIFDLIDKKMYTLNQEETEIITLCEKNVFVSKDQKLLQELQSLRLGRFYHNGIYVQKLRFGSPSRDQQVDKSSVVSRVFIEINNSCERDCWFCGCHGIKRTLGCMGCNKWKEDGKPLSHDRWKMVIDELRDLDCSDLFITGGDLTLAWDKTIDILNYADGRFSNIYIVLHQRSLSETTVDDLRNKAKIILQTENPKDLRFQDTSNLLITTPEAWEKTKDAIDDDTMISLAIRDSNCLAKGLSTLFKRDMFANMHVFLNNIKYHPCLGHTLTICNNGDVLACPMMRNHNFGNIADKELHTILEESIDKINMLWGLTLDKIEKCTGCEFRYACSDCRAIEENLTGRLKGKALCSYDPQEGKWG